MGFLAIAVGLAAAEDRPSELRSGELDALRAVFESELDLGSFQRTEVGQFLEVRWDSRELRRWTIDGLQQTAGAVSEEILQSFKDRNRKKLWLWPAAKESLGERADSRAFLIADPRGVHVQYARVGWDPAGELGLVYLELRPRESSEAVRAIFRVVRRVEGGWVLEPGRSAIDRGNYAREMESLD